MILIRKDFNKFGIFSLLTNDDGSNIYFTLEHAYLQEDGSFMAKIPDGSYTCVRGWHKLEGMDNAFETFEITGVEGHTDLLFHSGNVNNDSAGCVLLGLSRNEEEVFHSRAAFLKFMNSLQGINSFTLNVS